jgi:hypothetical protein
MEPLQRWRILSIVLRTIRAITYTVNIGIRGPARRLSCFQLL